MVIKLLDSPALLLLPRPVLLLAPVPFEIRVSAATAHPQDLVSKRQDMLEELVQSVVGVADHENGPFVSFQFFF